MRILFIAPMPPPVNGQSLACYALLEVLRRDHEVMVIDISKRGLVHGVDSMERVVEVARILVRLLVRRGKFDLAYLTLAESFAGNVRDLCVCLVCFGLLRRMVIHLHGGSLREELFDRHPVLRLVNCFVLGRTAAAIVTGPSHIRVFEGILPTERVHVACNGADEYLFCTERELVGKFSDTSVIRVVYLSSLTERKGYLRLLEAYQGLDEQAKTVLTIDFAGACESLHRERSFRELISRDRRLRYLGVIDEAQAKRSLLLGSHVFCLPSSFREGQPLSILEAYATGCVVMATHQPGILDVFQDGVNGFGLGDGSVESVRHALERVIEKRSSLMTTARVNRKLAGRRYKSSQFSASVSAVMRTVGETG